MPALRLWAPTCARAGVPGRGGGFWPANAQPGKGFAAKERGATFAPNARTAPFTTPPAAGRPQTKSGTYLPAR